MLIDLHNHTREYSRCASIGVNELIGLYVSRGIPGICITEHQRIWPIIEQKRLLRLYGKDILIFFGIEITTDIGDVLLFGEHEDQYTAGVSITDLTASLNRNKTALIWAHPFRWGNFRDRQISSKFLHQFDAVELFNGNLEASEIANCRQRLAPFRIKKTGGSDSHHLAKAARFATRFSSRCHSLSSLVFQLKNGSYGPVNIPLSQSVDKPTLIIKKLG